MDSIRRAQDTVRDQQRKYEAAESDYARISRQLDEFDARTEALRAEAQQLMLQVEEANAEIRTITEQTPGAKASWQFCRTKPNTRTSRSAAPAMS